MENPCCRLGAEYFSGKNILNESENFFVVPSVGQMGIEGYVLICSKKHFNGSGDIPSEYHDELEKITELTRERISSFYQSDSLVFEHGPKVGCFKGGGCLDHAHLHVVTTSKDILSNLLLDMKDRLSPKDYYKLERIEGFDPLSKIYNSQTSSYMYLQTPDCKKFATEVNFFIPSQYIRQIISKSEGLSNWNWRTNPDPGTFQKTLNSLRNKF
ncbi:hypothetical protein HOD29_06820 [archaeon]|jgi:hypothetical protein|nr:hypothetical protein [archaeon]